jgi:hypothetical protein
MSTDMASLNAVSLLAVVVSIAATLLLQGRRRISSATDSNSTVGAAFSALLGVFKKSPPLVFDTYDGADFSLSYALCGICDGGNNYLGLSGDAYSATSTLEVSSSTTLSDLILKVKREHEAKCKFFRSCVHSTGGRRGRACFTQQGSFLVVSFKITGQHDATRIYRWMMYDLTYRLPRSHPRVIKAREDLDKSLVELGLRPGMIVSMSCHSR